jgi:hypothetical protein
LDHALAQCAIMISLGKDNTESKDRLFSGYLYQNRSQAAKHVADVGRISTRHQPRHCAAGQDKLLRVSRAV